MTIFGLEPTSPWPEGWTPLEGVAVVKALDKAGQVGLVLATTAGLSEWESVGMLRAATNTHEDDLRTSFLDDTDDE